MSNWLFAASHRRARVFSRIKTQFRTSRHRPLNHIVAYAFCPGSKTPVRHAQHRLSFRFEPLPFPIFRQHSGLRPVHDSAKPGSRLLPEPPRGSIYPLPVLTFNTSSLSNLFLATLERTGCLCHQLAVAPPLDPHTDIRLSP